MGGVSERKVFASTKSPRHSGSSTTTPNLDSLYLKDFLKSDRAV